MQALKALVIGMGVLIVAGTAVVVVTIVHRLSSPKIGTIADVVLAEPAGTHIIAASDNAGVLSLVLSGGGVDRVLLVDVASGRRLGVVRLAQ